MSITWCETIKASKTLKQKLFYIPVASFVEAEKLGIVEGTDLLCISTTQYKRIGHVSLINNLVIDLYDGIPTVKGGKVELLYSIGRRDKPKIEGKRSWEDMRGCHSPRKGWVRKLEEFDIRVLENKQDGTIRDIMKQEDRDMAERFGNVVPWEWCEIRLGGLIIQYSDWLDGVYLEWFERWL